MAAVAPCGRSCTAGDDGNLAVKPRPADDNKRDACLPELRVAAILRTAEQPASVCNILSFLGSGSPLMDTDGGFPYRECVISFLIKITHIRKIGTGNGLHLSLSPHMGADGWLEKRLRRSRPTHSDGRSTVDPLG